MDDLDVMMQEKAVSIRKKAIDSLSEKYPHIFSEMHKFLSKSKNKAGLQVTENGKVIREYTFVLDGLNIKEVQSGVLSSEVHHPFGVVKPYAIMGKDALVRMIQDEEALINDPFSAINKYMPDVVIKFMR